MKSYKYKYSLIAFFGAILLCFPCSAQEMDLGNYKILFSFNTVKQSDNSRDLEVKFIARLKKNRKDIVPIYSAEIEFFNIKDEERISMGVQKTTNEGIALLKLPPNQSYLKDDNGFINLIAQFSGTDKIPEQSKKLRISDLHLQIDLTEIDSVRTVLVEAFTIDNQGAKNPIEEMDIIIAVDGMLSQLILEEDLLEYGQYQFAFPEDLPGDVNGNLTVYSIVDEHEDFGTVYKNDSVQWGVFDKEQKIDKNTLWSSSAPIWMYIVLTIMLVGVWVNYFYSIFHLFLLKKEEDLLDYNSEQ